MTKPEKQQISKWLRVRYRFGFGKSSSLIRQYGWVADLHKSDDYSGIAKDIVEQYKLNYGEK